MKPNNRHCPFLRLAFLFLLSLPLAGLAQSGTVRPAWPTASTEARPGTRWWWMGSAVDAENLAWNLGEYARTGIGTVEITPIYGVQGNEKNELGFLTTSWMNILKSTQEAAKANDINVDMNTGTGWPFGGPTVKLEHAAGKLAYVNAEFTSDGVTQQTIDVQLPATERNHSTLNRVLAYPMDASTANQPTTVTPFVEDGKTLKWTAPEGKWLVLAIYDSHTMQAVKRAAPGGEGYVLDHFNAEAVSNYLDRFDKAFANSGTPYPHAFFNDSYEVYYADWTPALFEEFERRRGYKLDHHMHQLLGFATDTGNQVLADYRQTLNDLLIENFTQQWTRWAHSHGSLTRNQAHGSPANLIDVYAAVDIPEIEGFGLTDFGIRGLRTDKGNTRSNYSDFSTLKFASSAAHVMGKPLTSSETFTWLTEHFRTSLSQMKPDMDLMFCAGVNHLLFHGTTYSPREAAWPGWKFYAAIDMSPTNSIWRDAPFMMQYIERCQSFLQMGQPDNDFLVYAPFTHAWHKGKRDGTLFADKLLTFPIDNLSQKLPDLTKCVTQIEAAGFDCDYISDRLLLNVRCEDGMLVTEGGTRYKALVVPVADYMPTDVRAHLEALASQGASIAWKYDEPTLLALGAQPEELRTKLGLRVIRRANADGHHYFVSNLSRDDVEGFVRLAVYDPGMALFDPMTGRICKPLVADDGALFVALKSGQSLIVQTYQAADVACDDVYQRTAPGAYISIDGPWTLSFADSCYTAAGLIQQPLPTTALPEVATWEDLDDQTAQLMGTGVYTTTFNVSPLQMRHANGGFRLALGDVRESARVYVNDRFVGCAWSAPFEVDCADAIHEGDNSLRIEVTNLPANRIRQMDIDNQKWRIFKDVNILDIANGQIGVSGITSYASWSKMPSGLHSPVALVPLHMEGSQPSVAIEAMQRESDANVYHPVYHVSMPDGQSITSLVVTDSQGSTLDDCPINLLPDGTATVLVRAATADGAVCCVCNGEAQALLPAYGAYQMARSFDFTRTDLPLDGWSNMGSGNNNFYGFTGGHQRYQTAKTGMPALQGLTFGDVANQTYYLFVGEGLVTLKDDAVFLPQSHGYEIAQLSYVQGTAARVEYNAADSVTTYCMGELWFPIKSRDAYRAYRMLNVYEPVVKPQNTAVQLPTVEALPRDAYYNLNGMRLNRRPTAKGVYIHRGRKFVVE